MPDIPNYLLGYGERLAEPVDVRQGGGPKKRPYTFEQAKERLIPKLEDTLEVIDDLPEIACPNDEAVVKLTLHPDFFAKSYFPGALLNSSALRTVGSRAQTITPELRSLDRKPEPAVTTELFVAGARTSFHQFVTDLPRWDPASNAAEDLQAIESFAAISATEKIRSLSVDDMEELPMEAVLHVRESTQDRYILGGFRNLLHELDLDYDAERMFYSGGLCFLRLRAAPAVVYELADFSFLRVVRRMPSIRMNTPSASMRTKTIEYPMRDGLDTQLRVAIFDGGLSPTSPLTRWTNAIDAPGIGDASPECLEHGESVTSALLFGSPQGQKLPRPPCHVDHYRVVDAVASEDPFELYDVLERVKTILDSGNYEFFNLSCGPELPVDDDEVHAWTAVLDEFLADGRTLATIAAGNTGDTASDPEIQISRVQVPSDCVNALTIGAADRTGSTWLKATYSSHGPGRSPGIVKPDLLTFGGSDDESFWVVDSDQSLTARGSMGTSLAAPAALRCGIAARAHLGAVLTPLAIRALLIHSAESADNPRTDVGWGRLSTDLANLIVCPPASIRVVYQDEISASQFRRIRLPIPHLELQGNVTLTATFCFATEIDPGHPGNYTKSGLSVIFRPHKGKFANDDAVHPKSARFFQPRELYPTEHSLRDDAHKWETCLHRSVVKRASSLDDPVFDIHYVARADSGPSHVSNKIRYALILTVNTPKFEGIYDHVAAAFRTQLQPLVPAIELPITV